MIQYVCCDFIDQPLIINDINKQRVVLKSNFIVLGYNGTLWW